MQKNIEKYLSKYIELLHRENLDQGKTKLVIKNGSAKVISNKKLLGSIHIVNGNACFQYEIS